jgi:ATP-dependent DNA helicase RecQ
MIFSDRSLIEMAALLPQDEGQFLDIHGVGELKLAKYGRDFLEVIGKDRGSVAATTQPGITPLKGVVTGSRAQQIGSRFLGGQTIEQIAAFFQIEPATVVEHLYRFQETGGKYDPSRVLCQSKLPGSDQARVFALFERLGKDRLSPIYQALGGAVPYQELHLLRLYWVSKAGITQQGQTKASG